MLCTHGKVIKTDLFNQFPGPIGPRLFGLVEVPEFVKFLTTSKTDLVRARGTHRELERLYDPIRQAFRAWLTSLGVQTMDQQASEDGPTLEREIQRLVTDIPELGEFFGYRGKREVLRPDESGRVPAYR
jgi:hypothetical protein